VREVINTPKIEAVIFDCDGTLVDSETLSLAVLIEFVAEFGLEIPHEEALQQFAGNELSVVFRTIEERLERSLPEDFLESFRERQIAVLKQKLQAIDGAHDLLAAISLPFCVASNAPHNKIQVCLETTGLDQHFAPDRIFSAYDIQVWKPKPDLFLKAAHEIGVAPENCAVVEDSSFGINAGLAAGMQVFAFNPHRPGPTDNSNVRNIQHLDELKPFFTSSQRT
jgi:HAD superfamily hydrolase (TIGR01509 family)